MTRLKTKLKNRFTHKSGLLKNWNGLGLKKLVVFLSQMYLFISYLAVYKLIIYYIHCFTLLISGVDRLSVHTRMHPHAWEGTSIFSTLQ